MIRNLLFDLGGVIMDICKADCVEAYRRLGMSEPERFFGEFSQQGPFMQLEEGAISVDEFHAALRPYLPADVTDAQIDEAFCRFLTGIPAHRLGALEQLRRRFKVYLLSNTNQVMWDSRIAEEFRKCGREREDYFDGMVTSFEARSLKPSPEIFRYAERKLGIDPEETLFIDDSRANLEAAARLGYNTALAAPGTDFADIIAAYPMQ
ncbi:MAG: HAD family phosphatase [Bacteroides sp.]|nr:HAD family phosphatase [Bacteroides sp.]MCM1096393.1 HAD family phosphatase [Terasakiella sp.]